MNAALVAIAEAMDAETELRDSNYVAQIDGRYTDIYLQTLERIMPYIPPRRHEVRASTGVTLL